MTFPVLPPASLMCSFVQRGGTDKTGGALSTPGAPAHLGKGTSAPACVRGRVS